MKYREEGSPLGTLRERREKPNIGKRERREMRG